MSGLSPRRSGAHRTARPSALRPATVLAGGFALLGTAVLTASSVSSSAAAQSYGLAPAVQTASVSLQASAVEQARELTESRHQALAAQSASREQARRDAIAAKKKADAAEKAHAKAAAAKKLKSAQANPKAVAKRVLADLGYGAEQWGCLQQLWQGESNWNYRVANASSGAYGIPQALPGSKMASAGADWRTNPETQIRWGLGYIKGSYGTPCGALGAWNSRYPHWY